MKEVTTTIGELKYGDKVLCTDGQWRDIEILEIHKPKRCYNIEFETGSVKCSGDHLWTFYDDFNVPFTITTDVAFKSKLCLYFSCGVIGGPKIISIIQIKPIPCRCITIKNSDDSLFEIFTEEGNPVFTHNCQQRLVCGQLGSIASRMALGDNQATTIDGEHKGAGMISSQGINANIQFYFEQVSWIENWFVNRGLTAKGWDKGEDPSAEIDPNSIDLGEDEDISIETKKTNIDFQGIHKEIDHTKDQKFEEI